MILMAAGPHGTFMVFMVQCGSGSNSGKCWSNISSPESMFQAPGLYSSGLLPCGRFTAPRHSLRVAQGIGYFLQVGLLLPGAFFIRA